VNSAKNIHRELGKKLYRINKITECKWWDDDTFLISSGGIHYYKSIEPAIYYEINNELWKDDYNEWDSAGNLLK